MVALAGAAVAVVLTPVLPAGLPVLCALLGLFALFVPRRRGRATGGRGRATDGSAGAAVPGEATVSGVAKPATPGEATAGVVAVDREEASC